MYKRIWSHVYVLGLGVVLEQAGNKTLLRKNCDAWKIIGFFEINMRKNIIKP